MEREVGGSEYAFCLRFYSNSQLLTPDFFRVSVNLTC
jgi:hypothetical protein